MRRRVEVRLAELAAERRRRAEADAAELASEARAAGLAADRAAAAAAAYQASRRRSERRLYLDLIGRKLPPHEVEQVQAEVRDLAAREERFIALAERARQAEATAKARAQAARRRMAEADRHCTIWKHVANTLAEAARRAEDRREEAEFEASLHWHGRRR